MSSSTDSSGNSKKTPDKDKVDIKESNISNDNTKGSIAPATNYYDDFFENFRQSYQNIVNAMEQNWPSSLLSTVRSMSPIEMFDKWTDTRMPLCDVLDKGDRYEITLEIPGIDKDKVDIKATKSSVRISANQSEKTKEKGKNYVYSERSYKSFYRQIPFIKEIIPSQIAAKVNNGVLEINIPKREPTRAEESKEYSVKIDR